LSASIRPVNLPFSSSRIVIAGLDQIDDALTNDTSRVGLRVREQRGRGGPVEALFVGPHRELSGQVLLQQLVRPRVATRRTRNQHLGILQRDDRRLGRHAERRDQLT
jgi:hypothetical protein